MIRCPRHGHHADPESFRQATGRLPHPVEDGIAAGRSSFLSRLRRATLAELRAERVDYGRELPNAHFEEAFRDGEVAMMKQLWPNRHADVMPTIEQDVAVPWVQE